jgi:thioredoxin-like negative regulator of GroEL
LRTLSEAQWAAGDPSRAVPNLKTVRRMAPDDVIAAALLSEVLLATGDGSAARGVWNEVAQEPTRSWRVESARAAAFSAANDAGSAIARQRAAVVDYLAPAP